MGSTSRQCMCARGSFCKKTSSRSSSILRPSTANVCAHAPLVPDTLPPLSPLNAVLFFVPAPPPPVQWSVWTLWMANGKPLIPGIHGHAPDQAELPGPPINLLWHDLKTIVESNTIVALPQTKTWGYNFHEIRQTFYKNVKYILANLKQWKVIVHVCACH